jgi:MYXO-CTERM domain-containing protein
MATKVTLYDEDGKTVLGSDAGSDGRAWVEYTATSQNKKILLKVEHPGGGIGRFRVAVAPAEWFKQKNAGVDPAEGEDEGCGSCAATSSSGPGASAVTLTLLVLVLLVARRRRRR